MTEFKHAYIDLGGDIQAIVDGRDLAELLAAGPWYASFCGNRVYAGRTNRVTGKAERMHTFLTGWSFVDHINANGLDNRRANLRPSTPTLNAANARINSRNTSGYKGVSWNKRVNRWRAYIGGSTSGTRVELGHYRTAEDAARAYDAAALARWGEHARLNFPSTPVRL